MGVRVEAPPQPSEELPGSTMMDKCRLSAPSEVLETFSFKVSDELGSQGRKTRLSATQSEYSSDIDKEQDESCTPNEKNIFSLPVSTESTAQPCRRLQSE